MSDQADRLRELVREAVELNPALRPLPPLIAVTTAVGGSGATTVACQTARELAQLGQQVLLIDANMAATDATVGRLTRVQANGSIGEVLNGKKRLVETLASAGAGIRVLSGRGATDPVPALDATALERLIAELAALGNDFDFVVVDTGLAPTPWTDQIWKLARSILLVTTPTPADVRASYAAVKTAHAANEEAASYDGRLRLVVNRGDGAAGGQVAEQFVQTCDRYLGLQIGSWCVLPRETPSIGDQRRSFNQAVRTLAADLITEYHVCAGRLHGKRPANAITI